MSDKRFVAVIWTITNRLPHQEGSGPLLLRRLRNTSLVAIAALTLAGCQRMNQPYSMHGLTRVPPPNTRAGYPGTDGYYGQGGTPANATSAIQPVGTVVAHNQSGAPRHGQGGMPSTDLTAGGTYPPTVAQPGGVSTASYTGAPTGYAGVPTQQFDAYGQPLLLGNDPASLQYDARQNVSPAGANTWSSDTSMNASMAGFTNTDSGSYGGTFSDNASSSTSGSLPSTGSNTLEAYQEGSNLHWK